MKKCSACGEIKPLVLFHKRAANKTDGRRPECKSCSTLAHRKWVSLNREHVYSYSKSFAENNREYYALKAREWRKNNPEKYRQHKAKYYSNNREKVLSSNAMWRSENREAYKAKSLRYKARKRYAGGSHSGQDIKDLMFSQNGMCPFCKNDIRTSYHVDHVVALSKGGSNNKENIQLLCPQCNMRKKARSQEQFARENGLLI